MAEGTIYVAPGTYEENVYVETESLTLLGYDPNGTEPVSLPIIDGNDLGPCLTLNSNSVARGFVLTGGESTFSCRGHDVTLSHCLLVGNQSTDPNAGVIDIAGQQCGVDPLHGQRQSGHVHFPFIPVPCLCTTRLFGVWI